MFSPPVAQTAVSEQESQPAILQILLMIGGNSVRHHHHTHLIKLAMPLPSRQIRPERCRGIHFRVGKRFVLTLIPAQPDKCPQLSRQLLFCIESEAVLYRAL